MIESLVERSVDCPFCGEIIDIVIDISAGGQTYIEDCQVCCQPMQIRFQTSEGHLDNVVVERDD